MPKALIVYSGRTLVPRRLVVPDRDEELDQHVAALHPAERYLAVEQDVVRSHPQVGRGHVTRHIVAEFHGRPEHEIPSGRCAVVDASGIVAEVIMADPGIDAHPAGKLIESDVANIGDRWDGAKFVAP